MKTMRGNKTEIGKEQGVWSSAQKGIGDRAPASLGIPFSYLLASVPMKGPRWQPFVTLAWPTSSFKHERPNVSRQLKANGDPKLYDPIEHVLCPLTISFALALLEETPTVRLTGAI